MHIYSHPLALPLQPGQVVRHKDSPEMHLIIRSGPVMGIKSQIYKVETPAGEIVPVKRENLKI